jgi:hypothetical protein
MDRETELKLINEYVASGKVHIITPEETELYNEEQNKRREKLFYRQINRFFANS